MIALSEDMDNINLYQQKSDVDSGEAIDFRDMAEKRAKYIQGQIHRQQILYSQQRQQAIASVSPVKSTRRDSLFVDNAADVTRNNTPQDAKRNEIDFKFNGSRARATSDEFVPPRWELDEEVQVCGLCNANFDWILRRKHHCRKCFRIVCHDCSNQRALLPQEYAVSNPQRVCTNCFEELSPIQHLLIPSIANHQKYNPIDTTKCINRYFNLPFSLTLGSEIRKAAYSTYNLFETNMLRDRSIPIELMKRAKGIAFLTVVKGGFGIGCNFGTGLVILRLPSGDWSAPTAIATVGMSWGTLIGCNITDYVIFLNTYEAVIAFSGVGQVSIGAGIDIAVGPIGRSGSADIILSQRGIAPCYSYAHSRGFYAGISLDGSVILSRPDVNEKFYGKRYDPLELLSGRVERPRAAQALYDAIEFAMYVNPSKYNHLKDLPLTSIPQSKSTNRCVRDIQNEKEYNSHNQKHTKIISHNQDHMVEESDGNDFVEDNDFLFF